MSVQVVTYETILSALRRVPVDQLSQVYDYLLDLQEDADDAAALRDTRVEYERTGDPGIPLDDYIRLHDLQEEVDAVAKAENLIAD